MDKGQSQSTDYHFNHCKAKAKFSHWNWTEFQWYACPAFEHHSSQQRYLELVTVLSSSRQQLAVSSPTTSKISCAKSLRSIMHCICNRFSASSSLQWSEVVGWVTRRPSALQKSLCHLFPKIKILFLINWQKWTHSQPRFTWKLVISLLCRSARVCISCMTHLENTQHTWTHSHLWTRSLHVTFFNDSYSLLSQSMQSVHHSTSISSFTLHISTGFMYMLSEYSCLSQRR